MSEIVELLFEMCGPAVLRSELDDCSASDSEVIDLTRVLGRSKVVVMG